jgi:arylsulfatase I/J
MKESGYKTAMTGKWDAGMATPQHTPMGRGYDSFYGYYQHANSYWDKGAGIQAVGEIDICLNKFTDLSIENATYRGGETDPTALDATCDDGTEDNEGCYEEHLFTQNTLRVLDAHDPNDPSSGPLFLFHSFHLIHTPLQVPKSYIRKAEARMAGNGTGSAGHDDESFFFDDSARKNYSAMVHYMDDVIGVITAKLKAKGMWEDTLVAFLSDNGGPIYKLGGANNHPLRGGKFGDFEGGIRTNALVTGGFVPDASRGTRYSGIVSIADWYGLFCDLAGADPTDAEAAAANEWLAPRGLPLLPPVDSVTGLWDAITTTTNSNNNNTAANNAAASIASRDNNANLRPILHQSDEALIMWPYKLVVGAQVSAQWTGPMYPNCSGMATQPYVDDFKILDVAMAAAADPAAALALYGGHDCGDRGCLYNIEADPYEHADLAADRDRDPAGKHEGRRAAMRAKLDELNEGLFLPHRGEMSVAACRVGASVGGYYGPFVGVGGLPQQPGGNKGNKAEKGEGSPDPYYTGPFPARVTHPTPAERQRAELYSAEVAELGNATVRKELADIAQALWPALAPGLFDSMDWCLPKPKPPGNTGSGAGNDQGHGQHKQLQQQQQQQLQQVGAGLEAMLQAAEGKGRGGLMASTLSSIMGV